MNIKMSVFYNSIALVMLALSSCVVASDISIETVNNGLLEESPLEQIGITTPKYPCSQVEPYNYNPAQCSDHWGYTCCTWYVGWGWREQWCLADDSCGWDFIDDYCVY